MQLPMLRINLLLHKALVGLALLAAAAVQAAEVRFERVANGVYAFIGETGARTSANEGLNANLGLVVTPAGALLIDSGASFQGARQIHEAVRGVTAQPVRWVINTGSQDHRWLGNDYFQAQGAELIAHAGAEADLRERGNDQLQALRAVLGTKADGTVPVLPTRWLQRSDERLELGGVAIELKHRGGAHTPGDLLVWLPAQRVLFSGDTVYVDRLLGVLPVSRSKAWLETFGAIEALNPERIVPGHGRVCTLDQAQREIRDYLLALRTHLKRAVDDWQDISVAVKAFDTRPWLHMQNSTELMPGNASRVYLELERE
jgi:glyoxylase-like metal-dependent hydrolase (beta-lactamase superfamily II)